LSLEDIKWFPDHGRIEQHAWRFFFPFWYALQAHCLFKEYKGLLKQPRGTERGLHHVDEYLSGG
jgi:hypothetical protein